MANAEKKAHKIQHCEGFAAEKPWTSQCFWILEASFWERSHGFRRPLSAWPSSRPNAFLLNCKENSQTCVSKEAQLSYATPKHGLSKSRRMQKGAKEHKRAPQMQARKRVQKGPSDKSAKECPCVNFQNDSGRNELPQLPEMGFTN